MRFIYICKSYPEEPDTGALLYTHGMISSLLQSGATGTVITYAPARCVGGADNLEVLSVQPPQRRRIFSLFSSLQSDAWCLRSEAFLNLFDQALKARPDVIIIDYFALGWVLPYIKQKISLLPSRPRLVYVSHNYEKGVRRAVALSSPRISMRGVMWLDAVKAGWLEDKLVGAVDLITAITDEDRKRYEAAAPKTKAITLKPAYDGEIGPTTPITLQTPRRVVLVGSFEWAGKQFILRRFLEAAEQPFLAAGVDLLVVGKTPPALIEELSQKYKAVRFTGRVDDVKPYVADARIGVMPDDVGGGFKLKIMYYVFAGLAVASIASQCAGLPLQPGQDIIVADDIGELVKRIVAVIDDIPALDAMRVSAWEACANEFDWKTRGQDLRAALGL